MPLRCLTGARFTMSATLLHRDNNYTPVNPDSYGTWEDSQDPLTGEVVKVWVPYSNTDNPPDPGAPTVGDIRCIARGIVDGGIRVAGTTERFGDTYENIDYAKLWVPADVRITKNDRITNIKDKHGVIQWRDEEFEDPSSTDPNMKLKATLFNVNGVTPLFNAFNEVTEWFVLLERAEIS